MQQPTSHRKQEKMNTKKIVVKAARSNPKATTYEIDIA